MEITICIPTFNRPESLARVLQHLSSFDSVPAEVVVGDNSGTASAQSVVNAFRDKFKSLVYLARPLNVGPMRNHDSVARVGSCPYVYISSDDDFVYENALMLMQNILHTRSNVVAVNGGYDGTRQGIIGENRDFSNVVGSIIPMKGYELLWNHLEITDNLPMVRRRDFGLHAQYREMSCGVAPVIFDLLGHGDFVHLNAPVLQHEQRSDSISSRIATQEVTDMANGDLEIVSCKGALLGHEASTVRGRVVRNVYFQGARVLFSSGKYLTGWHSLMRCNAYQGLSEKTKTWIEKNILSKVIVEKIIQIAADTGCSGIRSGDACIGNTWLSSLNLMLQGHPNMVPTDGNPPRQMVLTAGSDILPTSPAEVIVSLAGLVGQFTLSGCEIGVDVSTDALQIVSTNQQWNEMDGAGEMQIVALNTPYA